MAGYDLRNGRIGEVAGRIRNEGLGNVHKVLAADPDTYVRPETGPNSKAWSDNMVNLANAEQFSRNGGVGKAINAGQVWAGPDDGLVTNLAGKKVANTVLGDSDYMKKLKIGTGEAGVARYNKLLKGGAFHKDNPEVKAIAKRLGITSKGVARKPRRTTKQVNADKVTAAIATIKKEPTLQNVRSAQPKYNPNVPIRYEAMSVPNIVDGMAFGGGASIPMGNYLDMSSITPEVFAEQRRQEQELNLAYLASLGI